MSSVAIIGSGIAGLGAAHVLDPHRDVTLFEAADRLGGHANTVVVDDPDVGPLAIDTGFIVHNDRNYPNLVRLFDELGVERQDSEMSFGVHDPVSGLSYRATNPSTLFADRRNLVNGRYWRMLAEIPRFWFDARRALANGDRELTLDEFIARQGYSRELVEWHLVPMGAAIWSADPMTFGAFPAVSLFTFLANHGLLGLGDRPRWKTVVGGSRRYVDALADRLRGEVRHSSPVTSVARVDGGVEVTSRYGTERFDDVVLACHTDQALEILADASPDEKEILGSIAYQPNLATLHTDVSVLPPSERAQAAWNYEVHRGATAPTVTYDLTRLQRLSGSRRYLLSLNIDDRIDPAMVLRHFEYAHPVFDRAALDAQHRLGEINGDGGVHFAGAWAGHGFHEDGLRAALNVCESMGVRW
jgi:predicted NAD/FAD-binding protein